MGREDRTSGLEFLSPRLGNEKQTTQIYVPSTCFGCQSPPWKANEVGSICGEEEPHAHLNFKAPGAHLKLDWVENDRWIRQRTRKLSTSFFRGGSVP